MVAGIIAGYTTGYTSNRIMGNVFFNTVTEVNGINGGMIDDVADDVIKGGTGSMDNSAEMFRKVKDASYYYIK